jgi:pentatricopeptide repeat protein
MCEVGVQPDDITFICLLSACSHAGLVDEGMHMHASMIRHYTIPAKLEHYTNMVDLLGHAGHLQEAENMVMAIPCKPQVAAWMALLDGCRIHGYMEMAEYIAKQILAMDLKVLLVMYCCQTSMLLLAMGNSVRILNGRERKEV